MIYRRPPVCRPLPFRQHAQIAHPAFRGSHELLRALPFEQTERDTDLQCIVGSGKVQTDTAAAAPGNCTDI